MKAKILKLHESNSNSGSVTIRQCSIYDDIKLLGHVSMDWRTFMNTLRCGGSPLAIP